MSKFISPKPQARAKRVNGPCPPAKAQPTKPLNKKYISPFKSNITTGPPLHRRREQCDDFNYDLSKDECHFWGKSQIAMKAVPEGQKVMLRNGQRVAYLAVRHDQSPDRKYNYPEATSWRIGWLHNQRIKADNALKELNKGV